MGAVSTSSRAHRMKNLKGKRGASFFFLLAGKGKGEFQRNPTSGALGVGETRRRALPRGEEVERGMKGFIAHHEGDDSKKLQGKRF